MASKIVDQIVGPSSSADSEQQSKMEFKDCKIEGAIIVQHVAKGGRVTLNNQKG